MAMRNRLVWPRGGSISVMSGARESDRTWVAPMAGLARVSTIVATAEIFFASLSLTMSSLLLGALAARFSSPVKLGHFRPEALSAHKERPDTLGPPRIRPGAMTALDSTVMD
jgi:hypothetical protein